MDEQATYTVGQLARLAGVTVRTLHHYDEIGLLPPSGRAANGYRTYTDVDVARLQRILSWRALGFDLEQIARLVATDGTTGSALEQLREQHGLLLERIDRLQGIADTLRKTMEAHQMGINLTPAEMLEVFGEHDPTAHAAEAEQRWGESEAYRESARRTSAYGKEQWLQIRRESEDVDLAFRNAMAMGDAPDSPASLAAARAHRDHISRWFYDVTPQIHQGLARMYVEDGRFTAHYDAKAPGLAAFVSAAIDALYR